MCAIHGIIGNRESIIEHMIQAAHHRGPDGNGKWKDDDVTLGHNLLSIVDTETNSQQPWIHEDLVLTYNGEIYNYKELQTELNYEFITNTDTEVLAVGLKKFGIEFIEKLDGMFAFACYNRTTKELILARDSSGCKPLYYGHKEGMLHFSSEIKSLLSAGFDRKICKQALKHYYNQGYNSGYLTLFEGIKKLVPGQIDVINVKTKEKKSHNINNKNIPLTSATNPQELAEELRNRIHRAVKMTLMGRREIGLFLSGGIDSTSILYEMIQSGVKPSTFTSNFSTTLPGSMLNEDSEVAKQYCDELQIENNRLHQNEADFVNAMDDTFYALEEPRQGKSFPTYYNTNKFLASKGITVTLSGDGGDELLVGYKHHGLGHWTTKVNSLRMNHRGLKNKELQITLDEQMQYLNEWLPQGGIQGDNINDMMYTESLNSLCDDFLIRNDKLGMNFSMEARFPLMCNIVKDFARSIPSKIKADMATYVAGDKMAKAGKRITHKALFKKAYRNRLPDYILNKKKSGWRFPTDEILIGTQDHPGKNDSVLRSYIIETLKNKEIRELFELDDNIINNIFLNNKTYVPQPGSKHPPGLLKQKELFTILNFAVWKKVYKMSI
jgi:asparagine synthase (glutamine-hydrolysing)